MGVGQRGRQLVAAYGLEQGGVDAEIVVGYCETFSGGIGVVAGPPEACGSLEACGFGVDDSISCLRPQLIYRKIS